MMYAMLFRSVNMQIHATRHAGLRDPDKSYILTRWKKARETIEIEIRASKILQLKLKI